MRRVLASFAGTVAALVVVIGVVFVLGMRTKAPPVVDTVRRLGRASRPLALRSAGGPGEPSIVHHVGRVSGDVYETPVEAVRTDDGFAIALPYGPGADWARNVLAAGAATVVHQGATYAVERPEIVALADVDHHFSARNRAAHKVFGVTESLRVRLVDEDPSARA